MRDLSLSAVTVMTADKCGLRRRHCPAKMTVLRHMSDPFSLRLNPPDGALGRAIHFYALF